ncbi:MAG: T9SS type A sorting domain-containing protein, partial [Bacteroidales bacterium]|nr:T9SS type A sorting domain-containing protein [Bacteroidales bacterium]
AISYEIIDLQGKTIFARTEKSLNKINVDLNMPSGFYFLKIKDKSQERKIKLIIH